MKGIKAIRIKVKIGELWETPPLHILLTKEDDILIARCLEFTVSSHGNNEDEALQSLADAIKEYLLTASENNAIDTVFDPANGKYWRMYNELEARQTVINFKRSLKKSFGQVSHEKISESPAEITYG